MSVVFVVTNPELGWDCVVGVFDSNTMLLQEVEETFPSNQYVIHEHNVETNLDGWLV
jgi:hypothetical protein